jgi:hypothetical protein
VNRVPHERRLNEAPPLEGAGQRVAIEALEPRPQSDVRRGRILRLQASDLLDRPRQPLRAPLEQELAGQEHPVQLTTGEDAVGHASAR